MMSIWLADVNGKVVKAIVNKSFPEFLGKVSNVLEFISRHESNDTSYEHILTLFDCF